MNIIEIPSKWGQASWFRRDQSRSTHFGNCRV